MERRTVEDWVIRPLLKGTPDVVDVNSIGGFVKQYQVMVEPGLLRKYDLALHDVFMAVANNNANAGGKAGNTYGSVVSSVAGSADIDLTTYTDETKVTIILLSELQGNAATEASALDNALTSNSEALTKLHANVEANAVIKAKVEAANFTVDDVVAVKTAADGSLIVYVDDRA